MSNLENHTTMSDKAIDYYDHLRKSIKGQISGLIYRY
jgi:hypothetical protein